MWAGGRALVKGRPLSGRPRAALDAFQRSERCARGAPELAGTNAGGRPEGSAAVRPSRAGGIREIGGPESEPAGAIRNVQGKDGAAGPAGKLREAWSRFVIQQITISDRFAHFVRLPPRA
jgi:hypothetical protein